MKKSIFGVFALALVASIGMSAAMANAKLPTTFPDGFTATADDEVAINATNEALRGWQHYFQGATAPDGTSRETVYEDHNLALKASASGHTGKAMLFERKSATGEFVAYSYLTGVTPGQNYYIQAYVRGENAKDAKLVFSVQEKQGAAENRYTTVNTVEVNKAGTEVSFNGTDEVWKKIAFTYTAANNGLDMRIKIQAFGEGNMYVDDITMQTANVATNTVKYGLQSFDTKAYNWEVAVKDRTAERLTSAQISSESSDNDGASLKLDTGKYYSNFFGMLPHGKSYTLSLKYKTAYAGNLLVRIDNMNSAGKRKYYADDDTEDDRIAIAPSDKWQTFTYNFTTQQGQTDVQWMEMNFADCAADAHILIDELKVIGTDDDGKTMQYFANGSFSGAYTEGYFYENNANIAKQEDGSSVFMIGNASIDKTSGNGGYLEIDTTHLTNGKTYTLKFDYRAGNSDPAVRLYYGTYWNDQVSVTLSAPTHNLSSWTSASVDFVAGAEVTDNGDHTTVRNSSRFQIYGSYSGWPTYFRNFSIVDEDGNDYITNKTLKAPEMVLGEENLFNYGTFEGDIDYKADDWTFGGNAYVYGLTFETLYESKTYDETATYRKGDWKLIFRSTDDQPATATSKEITATASTVMIYKKMYYGEVKTTLLVGDKEIEPDSKGMFELPAGTEKFRVKFTGIDSYASLKYIYVLSHTHDAAPTDESAYKTIEATCTEKGGKCYTCASCHNNVYVQTTAALGHDWKHETKAATCKAGYEKDVCTRCKAEKDVVILPASGEHVYKTIVDKEATCTTNGLTHKECEVCGIKDKNTVIPKTGHHFENGKCTVCEAVDPDYVPGGDSSSAGGDTSSSEEEGGSSCEASVGGGAVALFAMSLLAVGYFIKRKED